MTDSKKGRSFWLIGYPKLYNLFNTEKLKFRERLILHSFGLPSCVFQLDAQTKFADY